MIILKKIFGLSPLELDLRRSGAKSSMSLLRQDYEIRKANRAKPKRPTKSLSNTLSQIVPIRSLL